jgi:AcrR family transcriptional regulator
VKAAFEETDGRRRRGAIARHAVLASAVDLGSREGLEALTIGRLADATGMSKSGLFAHFGSKEALQLAAVASAREIFVAEVVARASGDTGRERLESLLEAWMSYLEREVFPGGCFFMAASAEWDSRPGRVRDAVAEAMTAWLAVLERMIADAGVGAGRPAGQVAFELNAIGIAVNWQHQLLRDPQAFSHGRAALARVLERGTGAGDGRSRVPEQRR